MLFLMGLMATYCGAIYNEFFAIKPNMFGSCYNLNWPIQTEQNVARETSQKWMFRRWKPDCTYPFGLDPAWSFVENELTIVNNIKMKLSVIFGVFHMSLGIVHKGSNMIYHKKWLELFTEVFAGFFILFFLFGWMDVLIITKWFKTPDINSCIHYYTVDVRNVAGETVPTAICDGEYDNQRMEGIINIMVTTVFGFGGYEESTPPMIPLIGNKDASLSG